MKDKLANQDFFYTDLTILRKSVFLFNTLLLQDPVKVATRIEEKGLSRQLIKLLETHGKNDEDLADKVILMKIRFCN
jgi:hypothetical protein